MVAWQFAMGYPEKTEKLIILNLPHPRGLARELANNPEQQRNSQYARDFQQPGAHTQLTAEGLAAWVTDPDARGRYVEAFERSDFEVMLNYYKANYPREPYVEDTSPVVKVASSRAHVSRVGRPVPVAQRVERHLGVDRAGPHARDDSRRAARCGRLGDADDGGVVGAVSPLVEYRISNREYRISKCTTPVQHSLFNIHYSISIHAPPAPSSSWIA